MPDDTYSAQWDEETLDLLLHDCERSAPKLATTARAPYLQRNSVLLLVCGYGVQCESSKRIRVEPKGKSELTWAPHKEELQALWFPGTPGRKARQLCQRLPSTPQHSRHSNWN